MLGYSNQQNKSFYFDISDTDMTDPVVGDVE